VILQWKSPADHRQRNRLLGLVRSIGHSYSSAGLWDVQTANRAIAQGPQIRGGRKRLALDPISRFETFWKSGDPLFFVIQFVSAIFDIFSENVFQIYFLGARNIEFAQGLKMLRPTLVTQ